MEREKEGDRGRREKKKEGWRTGRSWERDKGEEKKEDEGQGGDTPCFCYTPDMKCWIKHCGGLCMRPCNFVCVS